MDDLQRRIAAVFREEAPQLIENLRRTASEGDAGGLHRVAHTLYGSLTHFDREDAAQLADRLQQIGRAGDLAEAPPLVEELVAQTEKLLQDLDGSENVQSARRSE